MLVFSSCVCVLHYMHSADNVHARIFTALQSFDHLLPHFALFFFATTVPLTLPCFSIPHHAVFHPPHPLKSSCRGPLVLRRPTTPPLLHHRLHLCLVLLPPQRAAKTPSAARAAPACPASTGIPKRRSPRCSLESPTVAKVTPCPPPVCGWAPAWAWSCSSRCPLPLMRMRGWRSQWPSVPVVGPRHGLQRPVMYYFDII